MLMFPDHVQNSGLALDILKVESWTQMGRTANIIIKYSIHVFASICKNMHILLMGRRYRERWNWLYYHDYGHGLWIYLILVLFWLSELGQIGGFRDFPGEPIEEMAWNFACWCILTTFRADLIMGRHSLLIYLILALFWLSETGQIWGFRAFWSCYVDFPHYGAPLTQTDHIWGFWASSRDRVGVNAEGERRHISDALHRVLSSCHWIYINHWNTCVSNN